MKASELDLKAVFILDNCVGYYDKVYATHKPLTDAATHPILNRVPLEIEARRKGLNSEIRRLEQLEPTQFGKKGFDPEEANTEYPFLLLAVAMGVDYATLKSPAAYFTAAESLRLYRIAHELLTLLPTLYPAIAAWSLALPPVL